MMSNTLFTHPNGSLEQVPPDKRTVAKSHETDETWSNHEKNRYAYKADQQTDPYEYKYYNLDEN